MSVWLLAAPDGLKGADGHPGRNACRSDAANNPRSDDVGLLAALIDEMVPATRLILRVCS